MPVYARGLSELRRDLRRADIALDKELKQELKEVGQIVADEGDIRGARFRGIGPYKPIVKARAVLVRQSKRSKRKRPDFGHLQMTRVLEPALDAKEREVVDGFDKAIGRVLRHANLN